MTKITKEDALALAVNFRVASVTLGNFRFSNWASLTAAERAALEADEWDLLNSSSVMITKAVGIAIDESATPVLRLQGAIKAGEKILKKIDTAKNALKITGALLALAGAIISQNPAAIFTASKGVYDIAKDLKKDED